MRDLAEAPKWIIDLARTAASAQLSPSVHDLSPRSNGATVRPASFVVADRGQRVRLIRLVA
jgi:hypothetical protein